MAAFIAPPETAHVARLGDRSLFPGLEARVYANHASISPPSVAVREAAAAVLDDYARRGAGAFVTWIVERNRLKEKLGKLVGAPASDMALLPNTTRGAIDVALCYPWKKGDRIVVFEGEFPANVTPWQRAAALFDLEVVFLPGADYLRDTPAALEALRRELDSGARLVAVSAVQFQTGFRMPLAEMSALCHARGAELFVDAVQACGVVPLDVVREGIDYLTCGSHKWLMGVEGCGFLYARPERAAALRPTVAGWLSHEDSVGFLLNGEGHLRYDRSIKKSIDFIEGGNCNVAGFAALEAGVDLLLQIGVPSIHAHVNAYLDRLEEGLLERGFTSLRSGEAAQRSGTLGVKPRAGASAVDVQRALTERGISCAVPDGVLRFSPHWPNALGEVEVILSEVDAVMSAARAS